MLGPLPGPKVRMYLSSGSFAPLVWRQVRSVFPGLLWLVLLAASGHSCSSGAFRKELVFERADLQQKIESRFPLTKKKALISATLSAPTVLLVEGGDRLGLGLAVKVSVPGKNYYGKVEVDGEIHYDPAAGSFSVMNARVRKLQSAALPERYQNIVKGIVDKVAQRYLSEVPVYQLKQEDFEQSLARFALKSVQVREGKLVVVIGLL